VSQLEPDPPGTDEAEYGGLLGAVDVLAKDGDSSKRRNDLWNDPMVERLERRGPGRGHHQDLLYRQRTAFRSDPVRQTV